MKKTIRDIEMAVLNKKTIKKLNSEDDNLSKLPESVERLSGLIGQRKWYAAREAVGDTLIHLSLIANMLGSDLENCINYSYDAAEYLEESLNKKNGV